MSTVPTVRVVGQCILAVLLASLGGGCGSDESPAQARHVTDEEWKSVIVDWYDDGEFDLSHRCRAVRAARRHLPSRSLELQSLHEDFRALEAGAC